MKYNANTNTNTKRKRTLKSIFLATFLSATLLNAIDIHAAGSILEEINSSKHYYYQHVVHDIQEKGSQVTTNTSDIVKESNIRIFLEGNEVTFDDGVILYKGNTYLPFRNLGDLLNAKVDWYESLTTGQVTITKTATLVIDNKTLAIPSGYTLAATNKYQGTAQTDEFEAIEIISASGERVQSINYNDRIYLPMRFICEFFGYQVDYQALNPLTNTKTIELYKGTKPSINLNTTVQEATTSWRPVGVTVGTEEQWEEFYTQKHPITGATPILGEYYISATTQGEVYAPVFDHNGDGLIGTIDASDHASTNNNKNYTISQYATLSNSDKNSYYQKECLEYFKQSVANTKPTTPGTYEEQETADGYWVWRDGKWVAAPAINNSGMRSVVGASGQTTITVATGRTYVINK